MPDTSFQRVARHMECWLGAADNMQNAAKLVWEACQETWRQMEQFYFSASPDGIPHSSVPYSTLDPVVMLLMGLCLENLIKGLRIKQDPSLVEEDQINKALFTHNLSRLFASAGITVTPEEQSFLKRVTSFVVWAGRYPFPKGVPSSDDRTIFGIDYATFSRLSNRIRGLLRQKA